VDEPCPTCDVIGPDPDAWTSSARDLHRAFHDFYRAFTVAFLPAVERMRAAAERERLARKDAYVLLNESVAASLRGER
jgi:hypothetical protein